MSNYTITAGDLVRIGQTGRAVWSVEYIYEDTAQLTRVSPSMKVIKMRATTASLVPA